MRNILKISIIMSFLAVLTGLIAACDSSSSTTASGPNQVHMSDTNFVQTSITIKKGESITLVNDVSAIHIITNGTWDSNGNARPKTEPGAPAINDQVGGSATQNVGPFNSAGTFQLYCTVHPGMNLTVLVK